MIVLSTSMDIAFVCNLLYGTIYLPATLEVVNRYQLWVFIFVIDCFVY